MPAILKSYTGELLQIDKPHLPFRTRKQSSERSGSGGRVIDSKTHESLEFVAWIKSNILIMKKIARKFRNCAKNVHCCSFIQAYRQNVCATCRQKKIMKCVECI